MRVILEEKTETIQFIFQINNRLKLVARFRAVTTSGRNSSGAINTADALTLLSSESVPWNGLRFRVEELNSSQKQETLTSCWQYKCFHSRCVWFTHSHHLRVQICIATNGVGFFIYRDIIPKHDVVREKEEAKGNSDKTVRRVSQIAAIQIG